MKGTKTLTYAECDVLVRLLDKQRKDLVEWYTSSTDALTDKESFTEIQNTIYQIFKAQKDSLQKASEFYASEFYASKFDGVFPKVILPPVNVNKVVLRFPDQEVYGEPHPTVQDMADFLNETLETQPELASTELTMITTWTNQGELYILPHGVHSADVVAGMGVRIYSGMEREETNQFDRQTMEPVSTEEK